jgi:hypothetical protein
MQTNTEVNTQGNSSLEREENHDGLFSPPMNVSGQAEEKKVSEQKGQREEAD